MANSNIVIVYRTGGTDNFKWHRSIEFMTYSEAKAGVDSLTQSGYLNYVLNADISNEIGLPETYGEDVKTPCRYEGEAYCVVDHVC